jgi:succinate dehydrogenase / fumarate reductase, cytochrome b subunit
MPRPVFFNLVQIQMPVGALTSITHRATGILLAVGIPYGVYLLDLSLQSLQSFAQLTGLFHQWPFKVAAIVFIWALAHARAGAVNAGGHQPSDLRASVSSGTAAY